MKMSDFLHHEQNFVIVCEMRYTMTTKLNLWWVFVVRFHGIILSYKMLAVCLDTSVTDQSFRFSNQMANNSRKEKGDK